MKHGDDVLPSFEITYSYHGKVRDAFVERSNNKYTVYVDNPIMEFHFEEIRKGELKYHGTEAPDLVNAIMKALQVHIS